MWIDAEYCLLVVAALRHGFAFLKRIGGMRAVEVHLFVLTRYLVTRMTALSHKTMGLGETGRALCTIYGRHAEETVDASMQGLLCVSCDGCKIGFVMCFN